MGNTCVLNCEYPGLYSLSCVCSSGGTEVMSHKCKSKEKCTHDRCNRFHNCLLHAGPPPGISATSALDRNSIMPVVGVHFRSGNGRIQEGNVLVDSSAGTMVIRKDFARALGLQGKREKIDIAVVGGETIVQRESR